MGMRGSIGVANAGTAKLRVKLLVIDLSCAIGLVDKRILEGILSLYLMGCRSMQAFTPRCLFCLGCLVSLFVGCATTKESDTARTGIEQLLVSSAVDQALDKIDLKPISGAKVYLEEKYLECVDKNYVIVSLEQRLLTNGCTLAGSADDADVVMHVTSGGVGTDRQEKFFGISEIPLPPPSPISIPQVTLLSRSRANGTARLRVVAFDVKTKLPVLGGEAVLARSDFKSWKVLGAGPVESGSVPSDIAMATGQSNSILDVPSQLVRKSDPVVQTTATAPSSPQAAQQW